MRPFHDFDLNEFWEASEYARRDYVGPPFTAADTERVENELGYRLPESFIALLQTQNGGIPRHTNHRTRERTSWSDDHIAITGIYSIGSAKIY